jgi:hypothetical protein
MYNFLNHIKMKNCQNCFKNTLIALLGSAILFAACLETNESESSDCDIESFIVNGEKWNIEGTNITFTYPKETPIEPLTPTITLSSGATINPQSGVAQNFFTAQGVTYTVTAEDGVKTKTYIAKAIIEVIDAGTTNDCIWTITGATGNYTLTISGNGAMADYGYDEETDVDNPVPWEQYIDSITTVIIQDGVTNIGKWAFSNCVNLTSVSIGNSVISIGDCAFRDCSSLVTINIPRPVASIGSETFESCTNLSVVNISGSVITIYDDAFEHCTKLTAVNVDVDNPNYASEDGVVFNKDKTILLFCPNGITGSYVIPSSVTTIGDYAFWECSGLTSMTIHESVTSIGDYAFNYCSGLTSITNLNPVPQNIITNVFYEVNINSCTLRVPAGSVDAYKAAAGWSSFENIVAIQ